MKNWKFPEQIPIHSDLRAAVGGHFLVVETLARRGIVDSAGARAFLDPSTYTPSSPFDLPGMEKAVERLTRAIRDGVKICVWGDFDVDGQTATALLVSTLRELGANVTYHIPIRERESHGVNIPALSQVIQAGARLILTCDTGISAQDAVRYANTQGVDVIVTDHHTPPETLPEALSLVNPKLGSPDHPAGSLPGVGVAYMLAGALYESFGIPGGETQYLDLAALGIVADLALLEADTRYFLQLGLAALRRTERPGLQTMLELAEVDPAGLTEEHIGFELGPRLNALGRLSDANPAVELLTTDDPARARVIATQLEGLNAQRKLLTTQVYEAAVAQIEHDPSLLRTEALVLAHPAWPAGVIGIVASRLVEAYGRPVALIAAPDGELARGSARSIPGVDITAAIAACRERLANFGGHPMAAGFALQGDQISAIRKMLSAAVGEQTSESELEPGLMIDGNLPLEELSPELVADLERLAPFGPGNPRPVLVARGLNLKSHKTLGRTGDHLQLVVTGDGEDAYKVIWWGGGTGELPAWLSEGVPFDLAYTARSSDFRGRRKVQLEWIDAHPAEGISTDIQEARQGIRVEDFRRAEHSVAILKGLLEEGDLLVWAEGEARGKLADQGIPASDRLGLTPHTRLAIWTSPPGIEELQTALGAVSPETVYLFAIDPEVDKLEPFILRLAGLVKYAIHLGAGRANLSVLAVSAAQRVATVRLGLDWLEARGYLKMVASEANDIAFTEGGQENPEELSLVSKQLHAALTETAAFRAHYSRADAEALIELQSSA